MKSICTGLLLVVFVTAPVLARQEPPALSARELIGEGVRRHDAGQFDDAIRRFKQALEIEPGNAEALYELATTYTATRQYDLCGETTLRALKNPGTLEGPLYATRGTCLSSAGKTAEALSAFQQGLAKHPDDPSLNFNIAVTLGNDGKPEQAVQHLQKVIAIRPSYSSPYFVLGAIAADAGREIEGLFYYLRFVSLEPASSRTATASAQAFALLTSGVSTDGGKGVSLSLDPFAGELSSLELGRTLAAATIHLEKSQAMSPAQRMVAALDGFLKIVEETGQRPGEAGTRQTFMWEKAAAPILGLQKRGVMEAFEYLLAARAGLEGAEEWLAKNPQKVKEMEAVLAELGQ